MTPEELANDTDFSYNLMLDIEIVTDEGAASPEVKTYDLQVCSTGWLAAHVHDSDIRNGRYHLIVARHNLPAIAKYVDQYLAGISGSSWTDVAPKLDRLAHWADDFPDESGHHVR